MAGRKRTSLPPIPQRPQRGVGVKIDAPTGRPADAAHPEAKAVQATVRGWLLAQQPPALRESGSCRTLFPLWCKIAVAFNNADGRAGLAVKH